MLLEAGGPADGGGRVDARGPRRPHRGVAADQPLLGRGAGVLRAAGGEGARRLRTVPAVVDERGQRPLSTPRAYARPLPPSRAPAERARRRRGTAPLRVGDRRRPLRPGLQLQAEREPVAPNTRAAGRKRGVFGEFPPTHGGLRRFRQKPGGSVGNSRRGRALGLTDQEVSAPKACRTSPEPCAETPLSVYSVVSVYSIYTGRERTFGRWCGRAGDEGLVARGRGRLERVHGQAVRRRDRCPPEAARAGLRLGGCAAGVALGLRASGRVERAGEVDAGRIRPLVQGAAQPPRPRARRRTGPGQSVAACSGAGGRGQLHDPGRDA